MGPIGFGFIFGFPQYRQDLITTSGSIFILGCLFDLRGIQQPDHFLDCPNVVCDARFHRWGDAQRLVDSAEIVVHKVNR